MNRQIILDTETTGLSTKDGHRLIEIGCLELIDRQLTGNNFHTYINPDREIEAGAQLVHGITSDFLADKPRFKEVAADFKRYIEGAELVIHNAEFDLSFLNYEFKLLDKKFPMVETFCGVFDTLPFARRIHPGQKNNLDALCKRYGVDNSNRELHGALLDAELLAFVYLAMTGGQASLFVDDNLSSKQTQVSMKVTRILKQKPLRVIHATHEELQAHMKLMERLVKSSEK